jgi:uncharacterized protein (TIGR02271 family)
MQDVQELTQMRGAPVVANGGEQIGEVDEIFLDNETGKPEWVCTTTGGKSVLVPLEGADVQENAISVPYGADQVASSPSVGSEEISQEQEQEIYAHYGISYGESRSDSGLPEGGAPRGAMADDAEFVRSEEELSVGTQQVQAGTARLRKWVETEPVTADVELHREAARVTREPIDQPVSGAEIGEQEIEVPLSAEQATVSKQAVAKERIGIDKEMETETQTISEEVRKERVEIDGENVEAR